MRVIIEMELNNVPYAEDVHSDIAYLQKYLQDLFGVGVEVEIDDLDYSDKLSLAQALRKK